MHPESMLQFIAAQRIRNFVNITHTQRVCLCCMLNGNNKINDNYLRKLKYKK